MKFLKDITEKKRSIVEKFKKNDFHFDEEELFLISTDADMRRMSFSRLSLGREYWTDGALSYFKNNVVGEDIDYIAEDTFYYACLEQIDTGDLRDLEDLMNYSSRFEEISTYFREKLKDKAYKASGLLSNFIITALIECNRFDLLSTINQYDQKLSLTSEMEDAILENYPFAYSTLAFKLNDEKLARKRGYLESLNIYELFELFNSGKENVFPILREKLFSLNEPLNHKIPISITVDKFYERLNSSDKEKFRELMISNNLDWYLSKASKEELEKNMSVIVSAIKDMDSSLSGPIAHESFLLQNRNVLDALLEKENFLLLFKSPLISEYIPKIIAKLDQGPGHKNNVTPSKELMKYFQRYPEVFRAILRNNYYFSFHTIDEKDVKGTSLEAIVLEEIQNRSVFDLPFSDGIDTLKRLLASGNVEGILENFSKFSKFFQSPNLLILSEEESKKFIAGIENNISLQNNALETFRSFIFVNPSIFRFYLHANSLILEKTIDYINHHEDLAHLYTDELYCEIKEYYAEKYHLKIDQLDQLESTFGPTIIRFFDNDTLQKITYLDDEKFAKLVALFPKTEFSFSLLETTYDSLKQYAFGKEKSDIISIFARIKHSVQDGTDDYKADLENLLSIMNDKFYKRFGKKYPDKIESCKVNPKEFLEHLVVQMKSSNPKEVEEAMSILHTITDYFIALKREQYREEYNMIEELSLPYEIDRKDFEKKITDYMMGFNVGISYHIDNSVVEVPIVRAVILELIKNGMEGTLASDVVYYYLKKDTNFSNDIQTIQRNVKFAIPIMKRLTLKHIEGIHEKFFITKFDNAEKLKRNYYAPKSDVDIYQILTALRIDSLEKNILSDTSQAEMMYQSLLHTMEKYKLHVMPSCFGKLLVSDSVQLSNDLTDIAGFISYYHQVYESEKRKLESQGKSTDNITLSLTNILINANVLSSVSSVYNQFLGTEDTRLVKTNPGPNYATDKTSGNERLKEAVAWTLKNFQKMGVTIPTFSEVVNFGEKKMRVVVGNFTHPSNITHGERTGACMRIGGVGESLFNFCLEDKNGFHIRFEDERTGEYISRVSGFRNGNTVFLNELRHSCNNELYSDEEIIEACKQISSTIIAESKDSTCPIENVVVARAYATDNLMETNLGISNNKKGLKAFYSDIQSSGVILASTGEPYTKVELDKANVPIYLPAREKTYIGSDNLKLMDMINRVHSVKQALSGVNYEYVEPVSFENEIVYGFVNQDWYVCMDSKGNIYEEIISIDKRAEEELESARKLITEYVPEKKEDVYQY